MTAVVPHQSYMTQHPSLFALTNYCVIAFSFAPMFTIDWFAERNGFLLCFCLLIESYETTNHCPLSCCHPVSVLGAK